MRFYSVANFLFAAGLVIFGGELKMANPSKVDKDKNGSIGYGEFLEMVLRQVR